MNLITDPWLTFRLADGSEKMLPIHDIADPTVIDLALPRADFYGAAYQFLIGVLQTTIAPENKRDWKNMFQQPPPKATLQNEFKRIEHAFNVTGDGPLFMQDFDLLENAKSSPVSGLLIEAPGENGLKLNTDHFIKRGIGEQMSLPMACLALFTLQINAPSGGQGHRVGLRGGGPLTTLIRPATVQTPLWKKLWLNVINRSFFPYDDPNLHDGSVFPWLAPTKTSDKKGTEIYATDDNIHELHMYWAMPRRIRLEITQGNASCAVSGLNVDTYVTNYRSQNYGGNYSGNWRHPLTPYKWDPKKPNSDHLSAKGQPGGINYKIWAALLLASEKEGQLCATVVEHFYEVHRYLEQEYTQFPALWVFGYDMDNMKARGWYSASLPIFNVPVEQQEDVFDTVKTLQELASKALSQCRSQLKAAWFSRPGDAGGDFSFVDVSFWQRTENAFYEAVNTIVETTQKTDSPLSPDSAQRWVKTIQRTVVDIFDEFALSELGNERSMAKRIKARQFLTGWLYGSKDIKKFRADFQIDTLKEVANG
ncbi:type I-E CRISPR-associated protein Cse1/CasA [Reinekea sp. G2M2-21]|uniref:type I-E CRISPR-associated protein Cse1/CasA n=1 Tax=Reinekea sp. G2M2-21 TaxID=2788942 RepID=UPI0018A94D12|nr:type I-E CRISPR-associated protein Cse1/CasA [Reinekea sp. G2M2-21]